MIYYILTTKSSECLNLLLEEEVFIHVRRDQPGSASFLDLVDGTSYGEISLVFFDRVRTSDTYRLLTAVYRLLSVANDDSAGPGKNLLRLEKAKEITPPVPFEPGTAAWERLATTRGRGMLQFFAGSRVLLEINPEDSVVMEQLDLLDEDKREDSDVPITKGVAVLERVLQDHLSENLEQLEQGLRSFDEQRPTEYPAGDAGRIDLLCKDTKGRLVVLELKKDRGGEKAFGQLCAYMAWVRENLADGNDVRGLLIANVIADKLRYAAKMVPGLELVRYDVTFNFTSVT